MDEHLSIGINIRRARLLRGMTQQVLADSCDLSKGMISKVENGVVVPAIATLSKIANALGVKVSELIEGEEQKSSIATINPFANPEKFNLTSTGYWIFNPAAGLWNSQLQPFLIIANEGEVEPHSVHHPGEEYIFIFEGEMVFKVGQKTYLMRTGDSLVFDANQNHGISSVTGTVRYVDLLVGRYANEENLEEDSTYSAAWKIQHAAET